MNRSGCMVDYFMVCNFKIRWMGTYRGWAAIRTNTVNLITQSVYARKQRNAPMYIGAFLCSYRPFSHCIDQAGLGAFTAKSGRKHYNPHPLTVMWMNFDSPNFPSFCSLSAIISFQTCSNKCILYVLSFLKLIKIKYKMVNMYGVFCD